MVVEWWFWFHGDFTVICWDWILVKWQFDGDFIGDFMEIQKDFAGDLIGLWLWTVANEMK